MFIFTSYKNRAFLLGSKWNYIAKTHFISFHSGLRFQLHLSTSLYISLYFNLEVVFIFISLMSYFICFWGVYFTSKYRFLWKIALWTLLLRNSGFFPIYSVSLYNEQHYFDIFSLITNFYFINCPALTWFKLKHEIKTPVWFRKGFKI